MNIKKCLFSLLCTLATCSVGYGGPIRPPPTVPELVKQATAPYFDNLVVSSATSIIHPGITYGTASQFDINLFITNGLYEGAAPPGANPIPPTPPSNSNTAIPSSALPSLANTQPVAVYFVDMKSSSVTINTFITTTQQFTDILSTATPSYDFPILVRNGAAISLQPVGTNTLFPDLLGQLDAQLTITNPDGSVQFLEYPFDDIQFYDFGYLNALASADKIPGYFMLGVISTNPDLYTADAQGSSDVYDLYATESDLTFVVELAAAPTTVPEPHVYLLIGSLLVAAYMLARRRVRA
jgi:hypothetical protein